MPNPGQVRRAEALPQAQVSRASSPHLSALLFPALTPLYPPSPPSPRPPPPHPPLLRPPLPWSSQPGCCQFIQRQRGEQRGGPGALKAQLALRPPPPVPTFSLSHRTPPSLRPLAAGCGALSSRLDWAFPAEAHSLPPPAPAATRPGGECGGPPQAPSEGPQHLLPPPLGATLGSTGTGKVVGWALGQTLPLPACKLVPPPEGGWGPSGLPSSPRAGGSPWGRGREAEAGR